MQEHGLIEKDISLYYRVEGESNEKTVVLLHGFGEDGKIWDDFALQLSSEYRLIIPDLLGSGRSTGILDDLSIESMAEHIRKIIEKESIDKCIMIGHSMGGYITLAFAEKYPQYLSAFGLFHSTAYADSEEKKETRKKNMDFIRKHGSAKFLQQATPALFADEFKKEHPEVIEEIIERYSNFSPTALVNYTAAMMNRPDRIKVLETFNKPVLFIMGEHDTAVPIGQGLKQCSIPEFSYIYIAVHSGHMGMLEEPEFCLKAIREFLSAE